VTRMTKQWGTCTAAAANSDSCPQFANYKVISDFFKANYNNYLTLNCSKDKTLYPIPPSLNQLSLQQYVYGWVPFNSGCGAGANALNPFAPKPWSPFDAAKNDYLQLQYNYSTVSSPAQVFNPFTELVHSKTYLNANSYAFSIDDAAGFQNHPGEGLIIALGGAHGLPNDTPVLPPADFSRDFEVDLADTMPQHSPLWKSYGICKNDVDTDFPPLPNGATNGSRTIIVDTVLNNISASHPCLLTVTDARGTKYQFEATLPIPWPSFTASTTRHHDPMVMSGPTGSGIVPPSSWCNCINELSIPAEPRFALITPPTEPPVPCSVPSLGSPRFKPRPTWDKAQESPSFR
jgi:hypothetical protein